jgi:hypothetical protein
VFPKDNLSALLFFQPQKEWQNTKQKAKISLPRVRQTIYSRLSISRLSAVGSLSNCPDDDE